MFLLLGMFFFNTLAWAQESPQSLSLQNIDCNELEKQLASIEKSKREKVIEACVDFKFEMLSLDEFRSIYNDVVGIKQAPTVKKKTTPKKEKKSVKKEEVIPKKNLQTSTVNPIEEKKKPQPVVEKATNITTKTNSSQLIAFGVGGVGLSCSALTYNKWKTSGTVTQEQLNLNHACVIIGVIGVSSGMVLKKLSQ